MESGQDVAEVEFEESPVRTRGGGGFCWSVLRYSGYLPFVSDDWVEVVEHRRTRTSSVSYSVIAESCPDEVEEGDDFRIVLTSDDSGGHGDIRPIDGYWYTLARSADESDYEYLYGKHQKANEYQRRTSRMGRDFHTLEDNYSEKTERFVVYFNNKSDGGMDAECTVTIIDDDGAGV